MLLCLVFPSQPAPTKAAAAQCRSVSAHRAGFLEGKVFG